MKSFDFSNIDLSNIEIPKDFFSNQILESQSHADLILDGVAEAKAKERAAILRSAEANAAQVELLQQQLNEIKEQNAVLKKNNTTLEELYESTKKEAEAAAADAKTSKRIAVISLIVSSAIAIAAIIFGILF